MIGIYKITSPTKKVYIGQSIDIKKRFGQYKKMDCKGQKILYRSFLKHGVEKHFFEILLQCEINELNNKERYFQDLYSAISKNGLNCKLTKSSDKSGKLSEETKALMRRKRDLSSEQRLKMRENLKIQQLNDPNWFKKCTKGIVGRKKTNEEKLKISIAHTGKKFSKETKLKMSLAKQNMSDETKSKIGLVAKGRKQSKETIEKRVSKLRGLKSKIVVNTETGIEYKGLKNVCELFDYKYNTLANMLNGHRKNNSIFVYK